MNLDNVPDLLYPFPEPKDLSLQLPISFVLLNKVCYPEILFIRYKSFHLYRIMKLKIPISFVLKLTYRL